MTSSSELGEANLPNCRATSRVLPRYDGQYKSFPAAVPYSLPKYPVPLSSANGKLCESVSQVQDAIASGSRVHFSNGSTTLIGRLEPSVLRPLGCGIGHHSREDMRRTLAAFQFLAVIGDSHSRHHYQGLQLFIDAVEGAAGALLCKTVEEPMTLPRSTIRWRRCDIQVCGKI